jgi:4-hydroxy-tetrahydrodipicolinate synthase
VRKNHKLEGVFPVVHTPFDDQDEIDWESLQREVEWAIGVGADGLATGMVSEVLRLSGDERLRLTERLLEFVAGRLPVVIAVGAESTRQAVAYTEHACRHGCAAIMATPPISARVSEEQLLVYYDQLARAADVPVIVQDASSYVGQSISLNVCRQLVERLGPDKVLFKPEAMPVGLHISALREATGGLARVFEGSGGIYLVDTFPRGIVGTMPGTEFLPGIVALWKALRGGETSMVYRLYLPICGLVALQLAMGLDGFLAVEKYVMKRRGIFRTEHRRGPYSWSLDDWARVQIDRLWEMLEGALSDSGVR